MINSETPNDNTQDGKIEEKPVKASKNDLRLKALEIIGFKSFAQKTKLIFDSSKTAVVGPNGCGKSNILDAIKWVLGEKSVKSIRGEKMEDVIFSGTENKKSANFAQVTLTLDNSSRKLNLNADEVSIGRRLYRDRQSHYLINERVVPRREIEYILMDTGLGKASYSFMEQGRMDQILSTKPEDRRLIFEEAAGISRYKVQKEEALKNLEATQINITRIKDILNELNREFQLKKDQASRTDIYNQLREKRSNHDLRIRYFTLNEMDKSLKELESQLQSKNTEKEKIQQKLLQIEQHIIIVNQKKQENQEKLHKKDVSNQIAREKILQWKKSIEEQEARKKQIHSTMEKTILKLEEFKKIIKNLKVQQAKQSQFTLELDLSIEDAEQSLTKSKNLQEKINNEIEQTQEKITNIITNEKNAKKELDDTRKEQARLIESLLIELQKETRAWPQELKTRAEEGKQILLIIKDFFNSNQENYQKVFNSVDQKLKALVNLPTGLRRLLLEKEGLYSRKNNTDALIIQQEERINELDQQKKVNFSNLENLRKEASKADQEFQNLENNIKQYKLQKGNIQEREESILDRINTEESNLKYFQEQFQKDESEMIFLEKDQKQYSKEIESLQSGITKELSLIESIEAQIKKLELNLQEFQNTIRKNNDKLNNLSQVTNEIEIKIGTLTGSREITIQDIYNDYNLNFAQLKEQFFRSRIRIEVDQNKISEIDKEIKELGPINPLAIEEQSAILKLLEHNKSQLEDIEIAHKNTLEVIDQINQKSKDTFHSTFEEIQKNFADVFSKLFNGGTANLTLSEPNSPLTSGIDISVQPPGKRPKSLRLLSGGEKALTAIALMFSIYIVRSSPFCVLDEIDAPLDDHNVTRFLNMLDNFTLKTQFILITHNKKTMSQCNKMFGVTMEEPGISRILGVELTPH